jgi:hypothetical protein
MKQRVKTLDDEQVRVVFTGEDFRLIFLRRHKTMRGTEKFKAVECVSIPLRFVGFVRETLYDATQY